LRLQPRTGRTLGAALLALALFACAHAQTRAGRGRESQSGSNQGARKKADGDAARSRREVQEAVAALREVEEAARSFDDLYAKVTTQADVADALWPYDEQAARAILRRAWEAVTVPGMSEKVRGFVPSETPGDGGGDELTTARRLVVEAAAKHDRSLADTLMREFERLLAAEAEGQREDKEREGESPPDSAQAQRYDRDLSAAGWQRLFIARGLANAGEYRRAAETAAPLVAEGACPALLDFILELLPHDEQDARNLYLRLLERTRADAGADANDVLLLSAPVVSPGLRVFIGDGGVSLMHYRAVALPVAVRGAFFDTAAAILLRAPAMGGNKALYFAVGHLLPFFERESQQYAPALHARLATLAADVAPASRESLGEMMGVTNSQPKNPLDPLAPLLSQLSSKLAETKDVKARDDARINVVLAATRHALWERARTVAAEVEGAEARQYARLVIAVRQVFEIARAFGDESDDPRSAADFVRGADVPPGVRAAGLALSAELAAPRGKRESADALLGEAEGLAAQTDPGEERATTLALVTLSALHVRSPLVWELLPKVTSAANESDDLFYGALSLHFGMEGLIESGQLPHAFDAPEPPVSLLEIFAAAARLDAVRVLKQARELEDKQLRADAMLAAARASLEKNARPRGDRAR
jgi:hypothetical protein